MMPDKIGKYLTILNTSDHIRNYFVILDKSDNIRQCWTKLDNNGQQAEAEVVPSSSLVDVESNKAISTKTKSTTTTVVPRSNN